MAASWSCRDLHRRKSTSRKSTFGSSPPENLKVRLLTVDIEKAFDSVNLNLLLKVLENYGFSQDFLKWTSILPQNE